MVDKQDIDRILDSYREIGGINAVVGQNLPSREEIAHLLDLIKNILFPGYFSKHHLSEEDLPYVIGNKVTQLRRHLTEEVYRSLTWETLEQRLKRTDDQNHAKARNISKIFVEYIPELRALLMKDVMACYEGDPASTSYSEVILAYPGFHAILTYRIAHYFYEQKVPLIPRLMTEIIHNETGVDIHPGAYIDEYFCIDHGTGIVIGETSIIGKWVKIYQGVTLGGLSVAKDMAKKKRHPTVEDHATIYANTTILGGKTVIGEHSIVGGNLWIVKSIPAHSTVYRAEMADQIIKSRKATP